MSLYEKLLAEAEKDNVTVIEKCFKSKAKGLCKNNKIGISKAVRTTAEKRCILAEELGHYHTSCGNIIDQSKTENRKQENRARRWAYEKLVPLEKFPHAFMAGVRNRHELAEYLDVIEDFLDEALEYYISKYGIYVAYNDYYIYFDPLIIIKCLE